MGTQLLATCPCGVSNEVSIGGTRASRGVFDFPHACYGCRKVVSVNILSEPLTCPSCLGSTLSSYQASGAGVWMYRFMSLFPDSFQRKFWRGAGESTPSSYYCPKNQTTYYLFPSRQRCVNCSENTLNFSLLSLFD
jgi:hypothetical protein